MEEIPEFQVVLKHSDQSVATSLLLLCGVNGHRGKDGARMFWI